MKKRMLACMMAVLLLISNSIFVYAKSDSNPPRKHISSSDLENIRQSWTLDITGDKKLKALVWDELTDDVSSYELGLAGIDAMGPAGYYGGLTSRAALNQNMCELTLDLSSLSSGTYKASVWQVRGTKMNCIGYYILRITDTDCYFDDTGYGEYEENILQDVLQTYSPEYYSGISLYDYRTIDNLDEIIAKTEEITSGCANDLEKVEAIHDWICRNITYDSNAYNQYNAGVVFLNKRAICQGFSNLFQVMANAANIPCATAYGYCSNAALSYIDEKTDVSTANHAWNLVYLDSKWHVVDTTFNNSDAYQFFGTDPYSFSLTRHTLSVQANPTFKLEFSKNPSKTKYKIGENFSFDGAVKCVNTDGSGSYTVKNNDNNLKIPEIDTSKEGKQTVKITYFSQTLEYEITISEQGDDLDGGQITGGDSNQNTGNGSNHNTESESSRNTDDDSSQTTENGSSDALTSIKQGTIFTMKNQQYKVTGVKKNALTVSLVKNQNKAAKTITVPATVTYSGKNSR